MLTRPGGVGSPAGTAPEAAAVESMLGCGWPQVPGAGWCLHLLAAPRLAGQGGHAQEKHRFCPFSAFPMTKLCVFLTSGSCFSSCREAPSELTGGNWRGGGEGKGHKTQEESWGGTVRSQRVSLKPANLDGNAALADHRNMPSAGGVQSRRCDEACEVAAVGATNPGAFLRPGCLAEVSFCGKNQ